MYCAPTQDESGGQAPGAWYRENDLRLGGGAKSRWSGRGQACRMEGPLREWRNWQTRKT